jgi:hypothetical protein
MESIFDKLGYDTGELEQVDLIEETEESVIGTARKDSEYVVLQLKKSVDMISDAGGLGSFAERVLTDADGDKHFGVGDYGLPVYTEEVDEGEIDGIVEQAQTADKTLRYMKNSTN